MCKTPLKVDFRLLTILCVFAIFAWSTNSYADDVQQPLNQLQELTSLYGRFALNPDSIAIQEWSSASCSHQAIPRLTSHCQSANTLSAFDSPWQSDFSQRFVARARTADETQAANDARLARPPGLPSDGGAASYRPGSYPAGADTAGSHEAEMQERARYNEAVNRKVSNRMMDFVHPGFGRWEKTIGSAHLRINFLNVKHCHGRDGRRDNVCPGMNFFASY